MAVRTSFASVYTLADVLLLAHTDSLHGTLSGPATKKLMERAWGLYGDLRYERLAAISVAHLYNLRQRSGYRRHRQVWTKTRPVTIPIGTRRAPAPNNRPGYLRVDSVHQGDQDGLKGVYHINAVDCVTQFEAVATCERISEAYLIPVLEELLHSFPFVIRGFHSDNGSEYINRHVADAETITDCKGRQRKRYPYKLMMTPYEKLQSLPDAAQYLKPEICFQTLDAFAASSSDNEAAERLNEARVRLFKSFSSRSKSAA